MGACPQPHSPVRCALCDCCSLSVLQVTPLLLRARRRPPPLLLLQARMSRWWSSSGRCVPGLTWGGLPCSQVTDRPSLSLQNIEARLKVSLPSDLGAALTDGVVLCHLANHVRPRSVPSIHVPSPAVVSKVLICAPPLRCAPLTVPSARSPNSPWPSVAETWRTSWRRVAASESHRYHAHLSDEPTTVNPNVCHQSSCQMSRRL